MTRTVVHDTFVLDRRYPAPPARVFNAFADPASKKQWWDDDEIEKNAPHVIDFRVGGRESMAGEIPGGEASFTFDAVYQDIVENSRIVYSYEMTMNGRRISVSVATIELRAAAGGTDFTLTEQGVYLDGLDNSAQRKQGTEDLMDALAKTL